METSTNRVRIPKNEWTPFNNEVFDQLRNLRLNRSAALYFCLYDRACHAPSGAVTTTLAALNRSTGMDERVIKKCLRELRQKELIVKVGQGVLHSRTKKDRWRVPLADFALTDGNWTPVPRILVQEYLRAYPNSVLLPVLLFYQNYREPQNFCYPGATKLSQRMNWPRNRINDALFTMFNDNEWDSRNTGLVRPLACKTYNNRYGKKSRKFRVRAVYYTNEPKPSKRSVTISKLFRERYGLGLE